MMLGARVGAWAKRGGWVNPYVTNGLVAMWDGEGSVLEGNSVYDVVHGLRAHTTHYRPSHNHQYDVFEKTENYINIRNLCLEIEKPDIIGNAIDGDSFTFEFVMCSYVESSEYGKRNHWLSPMNSIWNNTGQWYYQGWKKNGVLKPHYNSGCDSDGVLKYYGSFANDPNGAVYRYMKESVGSMKSSTFAAIPSTTAFNGTLLLCGNAYLYENFCANMKIYNARVYNRGLSDEEVAANYAIDKARFNLP